MSATRKQRLQEALRAELSDIIRRNMRDPRFTEGLLSITEVEVSPDLKYATVFISVLGDDEVRKRELNALRGAARVLRGELSRRKAFNNVPELRFQYDEAMERGTRIFALLEEVRREDAVRAEESQDTLEPDTSPEATA